MGDIVKFPESEADIIQYDAFLGIIHMCTDCEKQYIIREDKKGAENA